MKIKLLLIITLIFGLFSCEIERNNSDQCPEGEIMTSWTQYQDGTIQVNKCVKHFSCPEGKKIISQCSSIIGDVPCSLHCIGKDMSIPVR